MADRMRVTSLIWSRITVLEEASKNGYRRREHSLARSGCNEPGPFSEGYLNGGALGSLLMAFPGTGNTGVFSTEVNKAEYPACVGPPHRMQSGSRGCALRSRRLSYSRSARTPSPRNRD